MTIHPDRQTAGLIQREIDGGHFKDANAVIQTTVQHLAASGLAVGMSREDLDGSLAVAIEALERGEGMNGDQFFAEFEGEENETRRRE